MGAPDNCLLKGGSLPRCMKDTGMFDKILNSVILKYRHFSGKSSLVSVHLSKLRLPFILQLANQSANKKATISLIASVSFFYHRYLILQLWFSWRVIYTGATIQGHPTTIFGKYLFGRRFQIQNFRNICCKISCLPASPRIFELLKNGIIAHF